MKKITLFLLSFLIVFVVVAQDQRKWQGGQEVKVWDYATPNWKNPASPLPIPTTFSEGAAAIFDDSILRESDTLKISGAINAASVLVDATKTYVIRRTADTDSVFGAGAFTKQGTGLLVMDFKSGMQGGTILKAGTMKMEKQTTPNIWGSKIVFQGGTANFATTSSSSYPSITVPVEIPAGVTAKVELSRYSYWNSKITGSGNLQIFVGGERTYLGLKNIPPDWSAFTGNVKADKMIVSGVTPGSYGLMLNTNKTFIDSLNGFNIDSTFYNRRLTLGTGTNLIAESGTRAYAIGELVSDDSTSIVSGYYKESTTPVIRYFVGGLNTSVELKARFGEIPGVKKGYNKVALIKVGTGTYRLTHHNNNFIGGIIVRDGAILVDDDVLKGKYRGGLSVGTSGTALVESRGTLGGKGRIQAHVDMKGKLAPGSNGVGTLLIRDSISFSPDSVGGTRKFNLTLQPGSVAEFEIASAASYDKVITSGALRFNNDETQVLANPVIRIVALPGVLIKDGDTFEIIKSDSLYANAAQYTVEYPALQGVTWSSRTEVVTESPKSFKLIIVAQGASAVKSIRENQVKLYPNPAVGHANFTVAEGQINSIDIINLQGQVMRTDLVQASHYSMNISELNSGLYYARINTSTGQETHKLIVK